MEILDNVEMGSERSLNFTNRMKDSLTETAKWGKFLSIVGFVMIGFIVLMAICFSAMLSILPNQPGLEAIGGSRGFGVIFVVVYLLLALFLFFPTFYLLKFSSGILKNISSMDIMGIEGAFINLKSLYKYHGIFTIVVLALYAIGIFFAILIKL